MKSNEFKRLTITYFVLLGISFGILAAPPGKLPFYLAMAGIAGRACWIGANWRRQLALVLVVVALGLSVAEHRNGQALDHKIRALKTPKPRNP